MILDKIIFFQICNENSNIALMSLTLPMKKNVLIEYFEGKTDFDTPSNLLFASLEEFGEKPPSLVSVSDITRRAKCNVSAVSYYFGGKDGLYKELVDQIIAYIRQMEMPFWERFEFLKKSPSPNGARDILEDYFLWRLKLDNLTNRVLKNVISIIAREEVYNGDLYKSIYEGFMKTHHLFMSRSLEIASNGKLKGDDAKIAAMALSGQITRFMASQEYLQMNMRWEHFGEKEARKICDTLLNLLNKILS